MFNTKIIILIITILTSFLIGAYFSYNLFKLVRNIKIKKRFEISKFGEIEAKSYLKNLGFTIIAEQVSLNSSLYIDKVKYNYEVKVDFLVKKRNKKAIVEVKTGEEATNPLNINTRRQLLEYILLYDVDKIYLFDAKNKRLKEIRFLFNKIIDFKLFIFFGIMIGILINLILFLIFIK